MLFLAWKKNANAFENVYANYGISSTRNPAETPCTGYMGYPFEKSAADDAITFLFAPGIHRAESSTVAHGAVDCSALKRIP